MEHNNIQYVCTQVWIVMTRHHLFTLLEPSLDQQPIESTLAFYNCQASTFRVSTCMTWCMLKLNTGEYYYSAIM